MGFPAYMSTIPYRLVRVGRRLLKKEQEQIIYFWDKRGLAAFPPTAQHALHRLTSLTTKGHINYPRPVRLLQVRLL
jgi:hypothetical protein